MKASYAIGDWVKWHSKVKKRYLTGQIVQLYKSHAMIIWTTFDGQGHHWVEPYYKLRKVDLGV